MIGDEPAVIGRAGWPYRAVIFELKNRAEAPLRASNAISATASGIAEDFVPNGEERLDWVD